MSKISKNIKQYRIDASLTQEELAEKLAVTRQTVSSRETGRTQPDIEMLEALGSELSVSIEELIYGKKNNVGLEPEKKNGRNILTVILSIFGSLMTGVGLVLLFVSFWQEIGKNVKLILAFLPLAAGFGVSFYVFGIKHGKPAAKEGAAVLWTVGLFVTNALVDSLLNISLDAPELALIGAAGTLPIVFITNGMIPYITYLGAASVPLLIIQSDVSLKYMAAAAVLDVFVHLAGLFFIRKYKGIEIGKPVIKWVFALSAAANTVGTVIMIAEEMSLHGNPTAVFFTVVMSIAAAMFVMFYENEKPKELRIISALLVAVCAVADGIISLQSGMPSSSVSSVVFVAAVSLVITASGFVYARKSLTVNFIKLAVAAPAVLMNILMLIFRFDTENIAVIIISLALTVAVAFLVSGVKSEKISTANLGLAMICVLSMVIVIGSEIDIAVKGCCIAAFGIILLLINRLMIKKFGNESEGS